LGGLTDKIRMMSPDGNLAQMPRISILTSAVDDPLFGAALILHRPEVFSLDPFTFY
jgi:hypothetical protein